MSNQELQLKLESNTCKLHSQNAVIKFSNGDLEIEKVCCSDFKKILTDIIDEDLHQKYIDDLDNLFS